MKNTFVYNGLEFVRAKEDQTSSTHGLFQEVSGGIKLLTLESEPRALVCTNEVDAFTVTACKHNNGTRYLFATTTLTENFLQIEGKSLSQCRDISNRAIAEYHSIRRLA